MLYTMTIMIQTDIKTGETDEFLYRTITEKYQRQTEEIL